MTDIRTVKVGQVWKDWDGDEFTIIEQDPSTSSLVSHIGENTPGMYVMLADDLELVRDSDGEVVWESAVTE